MNHRARACLQMLREAGDAGVSSGDFERAHLPRYREHVDELLVTHGCDIDAEMLDKAVTIYRLAFEPEGLDSGQEAELPTSADLTPADAAEDALFVPPAAAGYADPEAA